jgi:hypothetical protein
MPVLDVADVPSLVLLDADVRRGLPEQGAAWDEAARQLAYYEMRGATLIRPRPLETVADFAARPKVAIHLTRRVITELGKGLYASPPTRELADAAGRETLDAVYKASDVDALLQHADRMTWLQGTHAIQALPAMKPDRPVRLYPWRRDEYCSWALDDDPSEVWAVCVRSLFPARRQVRYQLWSAREVRTYWSDVGDTDVQRRSGRNLTFDPGASGEHGLGCLPFVLTHNEPPVCGHDTPGLGGPLADVCAVLDEQASDLAQSIRVHCIPTRYADNVAAMGDHVHRAEGLIDLVPHQREREARIFFVQPDLQVEQVWYHLSRLANQTLQDLDLPLTADVDALSNPESGVAIVVRRMPLIDLWRARQSRWKGTEQALSAVVLTVAGSFHKRPRLVNAARGELTVTYPEPQLPLPTPERNDADAWELEQGLTSRIRLVQERNGLTRTQAIERIRQTVEDLREEAELYADVRPAGAPDGTAGKQGDPAVDGNADGDGNADDDPIPGEG